MSYDTAVRWLANRPFFSAVLVMTVFVVVGFARVEMIANDAQTDRARLDVAVARLDAAVTRIEQVAACQAKWAEKSTDVNHQQDALDSIRAASERDLQSLFLALLFNPPPDAREQYAQELRRHLRILARVDRIPDDPTLKKICADSSFR